MATPFELTSVACLLDSLAHIVDCEESNLDCSEKPSKNNELRKIKQLKPKPVGLKVRPIRTVIGQKKEKHKSRTRPNPSAH